MCSHPAFATRKCLKKPPILGGALDHRPNKYGLYSYNISKWFAEVKPGAVIDNYTLHWGIIKYKFYTSTVDCKLVYLVTLGHYYCCSISLSFLN